MYKFRPHRYVQNKVLMLDKLQYDLHILHIRIFQVLQMSKMYLPLDLSCSLVRDFSKMFVAYYLFLLQL